MSAQPVIAPADRPRWRPVVLEGGAEATPSASRPRLAPPTRAAAWRRRAAVALVPAALAVTLTVGIGGGTADAGPTDPVAGTVTVEPGETLWEVAAATAPDGSDPRDQLRRIVELNGFDRDHVEPWTVVLLPQR